MIPKLLTVLMSPDRTKHMSTVVKIKKNDTKTWKISQQIWYWIEKKYLNYTNRRRRRSGERSVGAGGRFLCGGHSLSVGGLPCIAARGASVCAVVAASHACRAQRVPAIENGKCFVNNTLNIKNMLIYIPMYIKYIYTYRFDIYVYWIFK